MAYAESLDRNVVTFDASAGSYIPDIMNEAVALLRLIHSGAEQNAKEVRVGPPDFIRSLRQYKEAGHSLATLTGCITVNGCKIPFDATHTGDEVYQKYQIESDRRSEEYRNSPEGKAQAAQRAQRLIDNQRMTDEGFAALRTIVAEDWQEQLFERAVDQPVGELAIRIFSLLASLIDSVDFSGVKWDANELRGLLLELGYKEKQYVAEAKHSSDIKVWRAYVAGQCIHCLNPEPVGFGRIPPVGAYMIRDRGLDTDTFIPKSE